MRKFILISFFSLLILIDSIYTGNKNSSPDQENQENVESDQNESPTDAGEKNKNSDRDQQLSPNRVNEVKAFYKKLNESLVKLSRVANFSSEAIDSLAEKFQALIGEGQHLILFNCKNPSFINYEGKLVQIKPNKMVKSLKKKDNCSDADNIWHYAGLRSFISTYDLKNKSLSLYVLPFGSLSQFFYRLEMCHEFMRFMRHPGYFLKSFKKPIECQKSTNTFKELRRSEFVKYFSLRIVNYLNENIFWF